LLLLLAASAAAFAQDKVRYVTDELAIVLRDSPSGDGASRGVITSGTRVQVLESQAASGYARVRAPDGREAWILERYLKAEPVARTRVERAEKDLASAQAELKKLKEDHARLLEDFARISGGEPVASRELMAETEKLREQLAQNEQQVAALKARYSAERARQNTLVLGGGLVVIGGLLTLLLRWLWPKRRWGDL
jgi:SH3 domain protein